MLSFKRVFCFEAGIGLSANSSLLLWHIFTFFKDHKPKNHDLIICHSAFVHIVMLVIAAELLSPDTFESLNFQNNFRCKASFYIYKVTRGLSICITSLLSMLQAITISPSTSWHQRRSQHLHSNSFLLRTSPEKRATETILPLVSFFVVAYSLDFIVSSSTMLLWVYSPIIYNVNRLMFNAYATVSPMVLIRSDKRIISILPKVHWQCHPFFKS
nr:putative vomeronasal receptor-like protein 4 [Aotus nancymaae]